jgi:tRNA (guanine37-N1)-methyltransferase
MLVSFVSLFPESTRSVIAASMIGRAVHSGLLEINEVQIRDFATDKHKKVDDTPCGGGPGQIMKVDVVVAALRSTLSDIKTRIILTDPAAKPFKQADAQRLAEYEHLIFVCGRYEGIDARIEHYADEAFSIGEYVLTGGELPALVMLDATVRHIPGVLGNPDSLLQESHLDDSLEYRQYTRPIEFEGHRVPEVLLTGDHAKIDAFRIEEQRLRGLQGPGSN